MNSFQVFEDKNIAKFNKIKLKEYTAGVGGGGFSRILYPCLKILMDEDEDEDEDEMLWEEDGMTMDELPEECIREILLRLSDSKDIDRAG